MYSDDLKIFARIKNMNDCINLQHDLSNIEKWCEEHFLPLNINKCQFLSVYRILTPSLYTYTISGISLNRQSEVKDLGVIFDTKMSFTFHIEYIIAKANSMFGFLKRNCKDFSNPFAIKSVYMSLVRPFLEYAVLTKFKKHLLDF